MEKQRGITLIALVIILVVVGIVIYSGIQYVQKYKNTQEVEDIKANMLAIQGVITSINNKHIVDEENNALEGLKLDLVNNTTEYNITEKFKEELSKLEEAELYILNKETLEKHSINDVNISNKEFYVVDYNSGEVYYSLGINGKYKLSEI